MPDRTQAHRRASFRACSADSYASGGYSMTVPSVMRITHALMTAFQGRVRTLSMRSITIGKSI